jgi:hypothetical protein
VPWQDNPKGVWGWRALAEWSGIVSLVVCYTQPHTTKLYTTALKMTLTICFVNVLMFASAARPTKMVGSRLLVQHTL